MARLRGVVHGPSPLMNITPYSAEWQPKIHHQPNIGSILTPNIGLLHDHAPTLHTYQKMIMLYILTVVFC
jgi:hypothetical protein